MSRINALLAAFFLMAMSLPERRRMLVRSDDRGSLSVEGVMIAIGLVAVAAVIITGITLYVTNHVNSLNGT